VRWPDEGAFAGGRVLAGLSFGEAAGVDADLRQHDGACVSMAVRASAWRCVRQHGGACIGVAVHSSAWRRVHRHGGAFFGVACIRRRDGAVGVRCERASFG
jgi:hypothetical protein